MSVSLPHVLSSLNPALNLPSSNIAQGILNAVGECPSPTSTLIPLATLVDSLFHKMTQSSLFKLVSMPDVFLLSFLWVLRVSVSHLRVLSSLFLLSDFPNNSMLILL